MIKEQKESKMSDRQVRSRLRMKHEQPKRYANYLMEQKRRKKAGPKSKVCWSSHLWRTILRFVTAVSSALIQLKHVVVTPVTNPVYWFVTAMSSSSTYLWHFAGSILAPWLCERSVDTRSPLSCLFGSCLFNGLPLNNYQLYMQVHVQYHWNVYV